MIRVDDLAIGFDGVPLLEHLKFEVKRGEVFIVLGGSGCGKSTLLRHLAGLDTPIAGTIDIDGHGPPSLEPRVGAPAPMAGVMFQSGALLGSMTLAENVALPLERWTDLSRTDVDAVVSAKLRLVGLQGSEEKFPSELSGGMKKRAGIARALALDSPLLFLDEPSAGLDPITSAELDDLILSLSKNLGMTMVIVTHELDSIFKIASRCIMLDKQSKGILAEGDPRELKRDATEPRVRAFFRREPVAS